LVWQLCSSADTFFLIQPTFTVMLWQHWCRCCCMGCSCCCGK